jgi:hypothetical protein
VSPSRIALPTLALAAALAGPALGLLPACGDGDEPGAGALEPSGYLALEEGASWTYRDIVDTAAPLPEEFVVARHEGAGRVGLRAGARWADGVAIGHLGWQEGDDLALSDWELGGEPGTGPVTLAAAGSADGDTTESGGFACTASFPVAIETWYARFEDGLAVTCAGDGALEGVWSLAPGFGLVRLEARAQTLDLVAPW